ncbi:MAG: galactose-1-phosphate uridylyltransferase [Thermodesulfobacteriota bacterium]|nr:galactose-1-phosphate uridylyltransferase [Thermodesulfobacteriota bacterium]
MSEFRQNLVTQEWVIIAPERGKKPTPLEARSVKQVDDIPEYSPQCPFCVDNDEQFQIIETFRIDDQHERWLTRSIENRYKTLSTYPSCPVQPARFENDGIYMRYDGCGLHEVVVETSLHNKVIATMTQKDVEHIISIYLHRYNHFGENPNNLITIIFKNHGVQAGASQPHAHSQMVGSRVVPLNTRYLLSEAQRFFDKAGICVMCEVLNYEFEEETRLIYQNGSFVGLIPYAANMPHETWIIPKIHQAGFNRIAEEEKRDLAEILRIILAKFYKAFHNPDFNYVIQSTPYPLSDVPFFHWYMRIVPRIKMPGGFEIGTRIHVNTVYPEESAEMLRECKV